MTAYRLSYEKTNGLSIRHACEAVITAGRITEEEKKKCQHQYVIFRRITGKEYWSQ